MTADSYEIAPLVDIDLDQPTEYLRCTPVDRGGGSGPALLFAHSAIGFDPAFELFAGDTVKLTLATAGGDVLWTVDLGPGVIPGIWFCPVFPFDLDGDGVEEIWHVGTADDEWHLPRGDPDQEKEFGSNDVEAPMQNEVLVRRDTATGEVTGTWDWPWHPEIGRYRYFITGGHVGGEPVLVTAQGTYHEMELQAWDPGVDRRWTHHIPSDIGPDAPDHPGARGSHMCPVVDLDGDGDDELLWGERLIDLDTGTELWCADRKTWHGHSDLVMPTYDFEAREWYVYTNREVTAYLDEDGNRQPRYDQSPRVVMYDASGERVWSAIDEGHMHHGWTARVGDDGRKLASAVDVERDLTGTESESREEVTGEFGWEAFSGDAVEGWPYPVKDTQPIDVDGDGVHEHVYRRDVGDYTAGDLIDREGALLARLDDDHQITASQTAKLIDHPGEQFVSTDGDGRVLIWGDANATDTEAARKRYEHPYYRKARRLSAVGYNFWNVAGL